MELEKTINDTFEKVQKLQDELEKFRAILYNEYFNEENEIKSDLILSDIQEIDSHILLLEKCKSAIKDTEIFIK